MRKKSNNYIGTRIFCIHLFCEKNLLPKNCESIYFAKLSHNFFLTKFNTVFASFRKIHFRDIQKKLFAKSFVFWNPSVQVMYFGTHQFDNAAQIQFI